MEEVRSSRAGARRIANGGGRPGYDDVFGGPPRYAAVPLDYAEIFGGLSSSCSIPYLDLPAALDVDFAELSGAAGFDYAEIFQGFGGGGFGLSYGELVAEPEAPELASESGRVTEETHFSQNVTEASSKPLDGPDGDHEACLDEDQFLSNSEHSDDGSKQFTASCNKTVWGSVEDTVNGTTENTVNGTTENAQLHKVPAFTVVINACSPLHNEITDNPLNTMDHGLKADTNGGDSDMKPEVLPSTSGGSIQSSVIGQTDDKHLATEDHAAEDVSLNVKQHSRSSSYHSISSGDISCTDATYVTVSDISLRTQPLQVAPPLRLPPKFGNKKENPVTRMHTNFKADLNGTGIFRHVMNNQTQFGNSVSRKHSLHRNAKDIPSFYDVEMDATSAAAASAAAMKEAMEQAQARLKSAKELMQRKRENTQSHNKHGHHEGKKYKEKQEDGAIEEVRDFSEDRVQKTLMNEDQRMKSAVNVWQEAKPKVAADHEEKERHTAEESQWAIQGKEMKSSHIVYNMDEETGEWKEDKQFYELINNEKKFRMVREDPEKEGIEKKQKVIEKSNEDTEIETKLAKRNRKLWEINDARECEVKDKILRAGNMALCEKEIKEIPSSIPDVHVQKENVNDQDGNHGSCKQEKSKKEMKLAQENHIGKEEEAKSVVSEEVSACGNSEKKVEPSNDDFKCKKDHGSGKEERRHNICEKELNITYINCEPQEGEMKVKQADKSGIQHADEEDIGGPNGSCVPEAAEKLKTTQLTSKHETLERTKGAADLECCTHEHINNLKGTAASLDHEESSPLNGTLEGCKWVENEKKLEVDEEPYEVDRNVKKLEISEEDLQQTQNENSREVFIEALQNHNEMKAKEIPAKVEQHEEKQDAAQVIYEAPQDHNEREEKESPVKVEQNQKKQDAVSVICGLEGSKKLTVAEGDCVHQEDGKDEEELKKDCRLNEAEEFCQRVVKGDLKSPQEDSILRMKGDILATSDNATESRDTENTIPDTQVEEKDKEGRVDRERELEKEQARRLEEEKEREREREKDRLAVEKGTCENHERALAEARERAERIAVERLTAEARQRALAEAREKAEKASREAKLKAELAAVERATAEAWEHAAERTLVEKAASDAREHAERLNASSRDRIRKDYESGDFFKGSTKEDNGTRIKDVSCAEQHQSVGPSISVQKYSHKNFSTEKFEEVQIESPLRCKARLERHQRTVERAAKALAEKNLRDILAQREQAERNRLAESLDAEIRRWSSGKEGNLRALLSTLQYILGPESGWQPIPLNDVITAAAVKKAYRKATLCVHPDKLQQRGANIQQKYICEKVFDLLKEAWNRFNSEER